MIGSQLSGRYDILDRIGGGGMALVYKAHDNILNRKVAIKVLRQQFVHDEDFIRRFRREAQSAASLSHPNVVNIYDVGQDGEIHYIVMELIEGDNLNERIKQFGPLQVEEAVRISGQICDALSHAHQNGIIHRDIKPHNILIGKNGRVKVTDFGIARAATSSDITQTGSVIGSVHYFSPEHAKGVSQGAKSDLYSLGIVQYQMLTNQLPFLGESPISIAIKHLQEHVVEPRKLNPVIPQSVENIILKALQKNPDDRYQSADEMLQDLDTCLLPERIDEAKVVFDQQSEEDDEQTKVIPALRSRVHVQEVEDPYGKPRAFDPPIEKPNRGQWRMNHWVWINPLIWFIVIVLVGWGGYTGVSKVLDSLPKDVQVPSVIGLPLDEARQTLIAANLSVAEPLLRSYHDTIEEGHVISQNRIHISVKEQFPVQLTISDGPRLIELANYIGEPFDQTYIELQRLGIDRSQIEREFVKSNEPVGTIVDQQPKAAERLNPETDQIKLVVSEGTGTFPMPNLIGLSLEEAKSYLIREQLTLIEEDGIRYAPSFTIPVDYVTRQFPINPGDPVSAGTEIVLYISTGYPPEAIEHIENIEVSPRMEGQMSTIQILYSDARGESREWGTREINQRSTFPIDVVLSPDHDGFITYYIDGSYGNSTQIRYDDVASSPDVDESSGVDQSEELGG